MYFLVEYKNGHCTYVVKNAKFSNDCIEGNFKFSTGGDNQNWSIGAGAWTFDSLQRLEMVKDLPEWAQENKIYYKVVNYDLRSVVAAGKYETQYIIGEWVKARDNTRLFVFENLDDAKNFRDDQGGIIFECEIKDGIQQRGYRYGSVNFDLFWKMFNLHGKVENDELPLADYPAVLAKEVKLLRRA